MLEYNPVNKGGTMRLGSKETIFKKETVKSTIQKLYGMPDTVSERHRHRYEINPDYVNTLEDAGMKFVGTDDKVERMEIMELENHPYYVGVQYHPEYLSRPLKPSPPFSGLILAAKGKLQSYLANGCKYSPRESSDNTSGKRGCERQLLFILNSFNPFKVQRNKNNILQTKCCITTYSKSSEIFFFFF